MSSTRDLVLFPRRISPIFNISKKDFERSKQIGDFSTNSRTDSPIEIQCSLAFFVLPVLSFFNWVFISPHRIRYDPSSKTFRKVKGSFLTKVGCICQHVSTFLYLSGSLNQFRKEDGNIMNGMYRLMFLVFIFLSASVCLILWTRMDKVAQILTTATQMTTYYQASGIHVPQSNSAKGMVWILVAAHILLAMAYALLTYRRFDLKGLTFFEILVSASKESVLTCSVIYPPLFGYRIDPTEINLLPKGLLLLIGAGCEISEISNHFVWIGANLMILLWGLMFRKMFKIFFLKAETNKFLGGNILEDIRDFNSLTMLLDLFNCTFGSMTFFVVISVVIYSSVSMGQIATSSIDNLTMLIVLLTLLPFFGMIFAASVVNDLANEMGDLIKGQFNYEKGGCWSRKYGKDVETCQGLSIVYYDLQTNVVGFKGLGFFTVSFAFIGSVVSIIATYAVVALQFIREK